MSKNVEISVNGDILRIEIDLAKDFGKSKSGKTLVVASSEGNVPVPDHPNMRLGINVYKYT
jgi:hypothetical protein